MLRRQCTASDNLDGPVIVRSVESRDYCMTLPKRNKIHDDNNAIQKSPHALINHKHHATGDDLDRMDLKSSESLRRMIDTDSDLQGAEQNAWSSQIHEFNCGVASSGSKKTSDIDQSSLIIDFQAGSIPHMNIQPDESKTKSTVGLPALHAIETPSKEK